MDYFLLCEVFSEILSLHVYTVRSYNEGGARGLCWFDRRLYRATARALIPINCCMQPQTDQDSLRNPGRAGQSCTGMPQRSAACQTLSTLRRTEQAATT
jgi:hypothetical protein